MRLLAAACLALALSACEVTLSAPTPPDSTPIFVTATLPATRTPIRTPTATLTGTPGLSLTAPVNCQDTAVLLQDVTIPDGTNVPYGTAFLKTWQFRNTGTCPWVGYKIAYASGDRMGSADTAPIPDTAPKADVNVSVELTAPTTDGIYTGFFELRNTADEAVAIGIEQTFWVKITVGNVTLPLPQAPTLTVPTVSSTLTSQKPPGSCSFTTSWAYPDELAQLINNARANAGLPALAVNAQLAAAAQAHSTDMACYSLLSHTGSNASTIQQRVAASGYPGSGSIEIIYGGYGAYPLTAFTWWMNDPTHRDAILNGSITDLGAGYTYVEDSAHGNYYTVDFGRQ
jgi:uncharacterized protein YkwD